MKFAFKKSFSPSRGHEQYVTPKAILRKTGRDFMQRHCSSQWDDETNTFFIYFNKKLQAT